MKFVKKSPRRTFFDKLRTSIFVRCKTHGLGDGTKAVPYDYIL